MTHISNIDREAELVSPLPNPSDIEISSFGINDIKNRTISSHTTI